MSEIAEIKELILAGCPGVYLLTEEESRADRVVGKIVDELGFKVREWNQGYGWVDFNNKQPSKTTSDNDVVCLKTDLYKLVDLDLDENIIVLKNIGLAFETDKQTQARVQQLLNRIHRHHQGKACVIFVSESKHIPTELECLLTMIELSSPGKDELRNIIKAFCKEKDVKISSHELSALISNCSGMAESTVKQVLLMAYNKYGGLGKEALATVLFQKELTISKSGVLEPITITGSIDDIGGLENLKSWLRRKSRIIGDIQKAKDVGSAICDGVSSF